MFQRNRFILMKRDVQIPTFDGYWKIYHIDSIFDVYKKEFIWHDYEAHDYWQNDHLFEVLDILTAWNKGANILYNQMVEELIAE